MHQAEVWKTPNSQAVHPAWLHGISISSLWRAQAAWSLATVAARGGGADAVRRENLNWRRGPCLRMLP